MTCKILNVLYAANDYYSPFLGVSLYSLFENNKDLDSITVYIVLDNVSNDNKSKLQNLSDNYNRKLVMVDAKEFNITLSKLHIPLYRGSYTTNYRLFFDKIISSDVDRLLYIDADTIVTGSLKNLLEFDMKDYPVAVVQDSLGSHYKGIISFSKSTPYFNAGFLFIHVKNWIKASITEKLMNHILHERAQYCNPDQDLLNIILKDDVLILPPEYNFQPIHRAYTDIQFDKVYGFDNYYTKEQIEDARKNPIVVHTYRFLNEFPWHKNNLHPDTKLFDKYLLCSPWKDYVKQKKEMSFIFKIERFLYRIMPKGLFLKLFDHVQYKSFYRHNKMLIQRHIY